MNLIRLAHISVVLWAAALALSVPNGFAVDTAPAAAATTAPKPRHFLIVLRPVPRLFDEKAWTKEDNAAVGEHFNRLKAGVAEGKVLLAGRTTEPLDRTMGLIIIAAPDEAAAREFMNGDPCVVAGVMTATLHPYGLALMAK